MKSILTSSDKETGKESTKITVRAGVGTDTEDAEGEIVLLSIFLPKKKEYFIIIFIIKIILKIKSIRKYNSRKGI